MGQVGRFCSQLGFLLRQRIPLQEALDLMATDAPDSQMASAIRTASLRISQGESLTSAMSAMLPRDLLALIGEMETRGVLDGQFEALGAWPDDGEAGEVPLARILAHASILIRHGRTLGEALVSALRPDDPEPVKTAIRAVVQSVVETGASFAEAMGRYPELFSPALRRILLQMERNGDAETTFRDLALALSRGWFLPGQSPADR